MDNNCLPNGQQLLDEWQTNVRLIGFEAPVVPSISFMSSPTNHREYPLRSFSLLSGTNQSTFSD